MKKFIILLLFFTVFTVFAQDEKLVYLKLKDNIAEYPGIRDFSSFKKNYPQFNGIINQFNIIDIKCIFRTKSKRIQSIYYVTVPASTNETKLISELKKIEGVEYAELPLKYEFSATVNDPDFSTEQWNLTKIQAPEAWDIYSGGTGYKTKIAIIDAGFNTSHEDLSANFWHNTAEVPNNGIDDDNNGWIDDYNGWDVANDDKIVNLDANETDATYGHGTFVSGFAAAITNNSLGIASVSHNNAEIIPIKVGNNDVNGNAQIPPGTLPYGMDYAINNGAEIISMSISAQYESYLGDYAGQTMHEFVQEAANHGIIMVAATGNGAAYYTEISYPARYPEVIAVGSTDENDYKASSSQYSEDVDIMAPGHLVYSTIQESPWYQGGWSGTSFSTPTVASALALMKSFQPTATVDQLKQCLYSGADDIESIGANTPYVGKLGHGRLNVYNSMHCLDSIFAVNELPTCVITSPTNGQIFTQGDVVSLSATASDPDGTIDSVIFVVDTIYNFATITTSPYQYSLQTDTTIPTGVYSFHALAYDNNQAVASSDTIYVTLIELFTNINAISFNNFNIYPNPAKNNVQLSIINEQLGETVKILDIIGKVIKQLKIKDEKLKIDISSLQNGVYFVRIGNTVQKFIKK